MTTASYSVGDLVDVDLGGGQFTAGQVVSVVPAAAGGVWEYDIQIHGGVVVSSQPRYVRPPATEWKQLDDVAKCPNCGQQSRSYSRGCSQCGFGRPA